MSLPQPIPPSDFLLIQIVDSALVTAAHRSGDWLVCKPGCHQCCLGVFAINQLDAARLRHGLDALRASDPGRAVRLVHRVENSAQRLAVDFPGNPVSGLLGEDIAAEEAFDSFANDEPCPVLDPATGTCDLYAWRPMTCRIFGPPVRSEEGLGVCELCYHGATEEEIAACEMVPDPGDLESSVLSQLEQQSGSYGRTIVTFALTGSQPSQAQQGQLNDHPATT